MGSENIRWHHAASGTRLHAIEAFNSPALCGVYVYANDRAPTGEKCKPCLRALEAWKAREVAQRQSA